MRLASTLVLPVLLGAAAAQAPFVNFETGPTAPMRLTPDGQRLLVADTVASRLCVYDLRDPSRPLLLDEIAVGLEPVAVNARTDDEVWVCNQLSDSVSIVSLQQRRVVATLRTADEPSDVVFANGRAFVSAATVDAVQVFDVATRQLAGTVAIPNKDPRALAVSPDGSRVYAVVQRSGNGTTVIPENLAPLPPPPQNTALPPAPRQGILVRADDPAWQGLVPFTLPDNDVAEIDAGSLALVRSFRRVGTTNTAIAVHPSGELWIANTEARNLVRFEPNVRGHAIDSRLTRVTTGAVPVVTPFDLNAGITYAALPDPAAAAIALAEPSAVVLDPATDRLWVAAQGTDRIGVVDRSGAVLQRIEVGNTPGALVDTRQKRGPRALALHPTASRLYVLNWLSHSLSVIDTQAGTVLREDPLGSHDPMPTAMRTGRRFLYDAKLSGNGTMSCASCHVDADLDGLAWDLGDPTGSLQAPPSQPFPFFLGLTSQHPMKGPRTTQTLKGIGSTEPLHWGGDRANFAAFNGAFASLMGGAPLSTADMNLFAAWGTSIAFPPNPNQPLDRSYLTTPANNNQAAGLAAFQATVANLPLIGTVGCVTCHALPTGSNRMIVAATVLQEAQQMKVPQLRNLYRKVGFTRAPGPQKHGFGYTKDGAVDTLTSFLQLSQFVNWPAATKDDIQTFLLAFDTGTAPLVGQQVTIDATNGNDPAATARVNLLLQRAAAGDVDVVAHGLLDGRIAGLAYRPATGDWLLDRVTATPLTWPQLQQKALAGQAALTLTGTTPGSGPRLALDRDLDGARDGDELGLPYGTATAGCSGAPALRGNAEPAVGNAGFALVVEDAPPAGVALLALALAPAALPVAGVTLLVDPGTATAVLLLADARGAAAHRLPIPGDPTFAGLGLFGQVATFDACAPAGLAASRGLAVTIRP